MILVVGEQSLVDRHEDILQKFNHNNIKIIKLYEKDMIKEFFNIHKFEKIIVCSKEKTLINNFIKKGIPLFNLYYVSNEYPSAIVFYYLRINHIKLNDVSIDNFLKLLEDKTITDTCKRNLYSKHSLDDNTYDIAFDFSDPSLNSSILNLAKTFSKRVKTINLFYTEKENKKFNLKTSIVLDNEIEFNERALEIISPSKYFISPLLKNTPKNVVNIHFVHTMILIPINKKLLFDFFSRADYIVLPTKTHFDQVKEILTLYKPELKKAVALIPGGYPKLDKLINDLQQSKMEKDSICFAPTIFYEDFNNDIGGILSLKNGKEIIQVLLDSFPTFNIIFRPHPHIKNKESYGKSIMFDIIDTFESNPRFIYDDSNYYIDTFARSKILISDFSSTMQTFSFATGSPFIGFSNKDFETNYKKIFGEEDIRKYCGEIIFNIDELTKKIEKIFGNMDVYKEKIINYRKKELFNLNSSVDYFIDNFEYIKNNKRHKDWEYI